MPYGYNEVMLLKELDVYFRSLMRISELERVDASLNGIQVGRAGRQINKVAFAVDASLETFRRAVREEADMLFVHHGLFWGTPERVEGVLYERLKFLLENDLSLYASHLPLDLQPEFGNNAVLARILGLEELEPFGIYRGVAIGFKGVFPKPKTLDEVIGLLFGDHREHYGVLPFGPELIRKVGIISGGAAQDALQAIAEGLDLFVTGEPAHQIYHPVLEAGLHVVAGGHYMTEIWGVKQLAEKLARDRDVETVFIDVPTGL